ncbi:MAG: FKBP-type peptidyl-prolyl cis-trans isomerase, partial [bacterium]|nr:FKBP-type peptidyl-prolyl cis-trans isomerase [bacterium]
MTCKSKFFSLIGLTALIVSMIALTACPKKGGSTTQAGDLKTEIEKVSYILGYSTGKSFQEQSVDVDTKIFMNALMEGMANSEAQPALSEEQMRETMQNFRTSLMEKRKKMMEEAVVTNQKAGDEFLAANKAKPGVVTLPSGLQYKVITEGKGDIASGNDNVTVDYTGKLLNGKTFDSTETRGKPATFAIGSTIPGMSEALKLMPTGSTWEVYIPASLAYGAQGAGATIGPNETL